MRERRLSGRTSAVLGVSWANGGNRRTLAVAARSGDGPFTIRFADLHHRVMQTGGLVSWRSTPWQAA
jgi:hypothetical protein